MEQRRSIRVLGFHAVVLPLVALLQPLELPLLVEGILAADILLQVGLSGRRLLRLARGRGVRGGRGRADERRATVEGVLVRTLPRHGGDLAAYALGDEDAPQI